MWHECADFNTLKKVLENLNDNEIIHTDKKHSPAQHVRRIFSDLKCLKDHETSKAEVLQQLSAIDVNLSQVVVNQVNMK